jgi:hypothetical protein
MYLNYPHSFSYIYSFKTEYSCLVREILSFISTSPALVILYFSSSIPTTHEKAHMSGGIPASHAHLASLPMAASLLQRSSSAVHRQPTSLLTRLLSLLSPPSADGLPPSSAGLLRRRQGPREREGEVATSSPAVLPPVLRSEVQRSTTRRSRRGA